MPNVEEEAIVKWNALLHPGEKYILCPKINGIRSIVGGCIPPEGHRNHTIELIEILTEINTGWSQYIPDVLVRCITCNGERIRVNAQFLELKKEGENMLELKKIHEDARGEIYAIPLEEDKELTILMTNAGYARGGCIHPDNDEHCVVVKGVIRYFRGDFNTTLTKGDTVFIQKGIPHFFISETDSILMEWGATLKEKDMKHQPFRNIVLDINKVKEREKRRKK